MKLSLRRIFLLLGLACIIQDKCCKMNEYQKALQFPLYITLQFKGFYSPLDIHSNNKQGETRFTDVVSKPWKTIQYRHHQI